MTSRIKLSDRALLARAATDPQAFAAFYDRHERPLLAFASRMTRDVELASDVVAEAFAVLLEQLGRGVRIDEPRGWMYTVVRRLVIDGARRGKVESAARERLGMEPVVLTDDALERVERLVDESSSEARAAFNELPAEQRAAIEARVFDEEDYVDIADRLSCSDAVIRKRVSRGLAQVRRRLDETRS